MISNAIVIVFFIAIIVICLINALVISENMFVLHERLNDIDQRIERLNNGENSKWVDVADEMPEISGDYLCYEVSEDGDENYVVMAYLEGNSYFGGKGSGYQIEYWRLLPPSPTKTKYPFTESGGDEA